MHTLPPLPYTYDALEPFFDERTMRLHHTKHHQGYIDKLNAALEAHPELIIKPLEALLEDLTRVPAEIRETVRNHGGGHWNHGFFWSSLAPAESAETEFPASLEAALEKDFSGLDDFKEQFKKLALGRFGSGWVWLLKRDDGSLSLVDTPNQDSPLGLGEPLLGLDVWEHAYYLKYENRRADYVDAFFKIINWQKVAERLVAPSQV